MNYKSSQYVRFIDKVESLTYSVKVNPKVYFQEDYLLDCCYKELGIAIKAKCLTSAIEYLEWVVHDFTLALELDSKQALSYQNRATANYAWVIFCQNQYEFVQLISNIVLDCDLALIIEPNLQIVASQKMHVFSVQA